MALSPHEEDVLADLETQFDADGRWGDIPPGARLAPAVACVLAGIALLVGGRQGWFTDRISFVSGFSATSIALACTVIGCMLVLGAPLVLRGLASIAPGGSLSHPPSPGRQMRQRTMR